jgi:hypothetical protein
MSGKNYLSNSSSSAAISRWIPPLVVFGVVGGFVALSWYAYHSNTPTKEGDLMVVEADKTPMKEKPLDAGGMQFPNQDKTIFDTFSSGSDQLPKVERVLPTPEEPVAKPVVTQDSGNWIKEEKRADVAAAKPEQMIAPAGGAMQSKQDVMASVEKPMAKPVMPEESRKAAETKIATEIAPQAGDQTTMYVAPAASQNNAVVPVPNKEEEKAPMSPVDTSSVSVKEKPLPMHEAAPALPAKAPMKAVDKTDAATEQMDAIVGFKGKPDGKTKVQLGAYHSEKEAQDAWSAIQKKHHNLLANASRTIVKADLGDKGIYYRLQMGGFANPAAAKALCSKLTASGQACIPASK